MLYSSDIEGVIGFCIFNDHSSFVECETHAKFKHNIRIFSADITNYHFSIMKILDYTFLDNAYLVSFANQMDSELVSWHRADGISKNLSNICPMVRSIRTDSRYRHNQAA